ncbi:MFS transporter [Streptomyces sp. HMX112]|uniref:MFS transporter n=1 Tax=Streptomyces sp. HMX112 TaxID=3390850 RepID=UPI003A7FE32B
MGGFPLVQNGRQAAPPPPGEPAAAPPRAVPPGPGRVRLAAAGLLLALLLAALQQMIAVTALPGAADGPRGPGRPPWATTAHLLATAVGALLFGRLGDLRGHRGAFQFAAAVFVAGSALAGWSRTTDQLVAFRALQGLGAGGLVVGAQAIITDIVPARARGRYTGLVCAAFGLGSAAGPLLGHLLTGQVSWRWCFHGAVPLALLALAAVTAALRTAGPKPPRPAVPGRFDLLGALLLTAASTCLVLLAGWGGTRYSWGSREVAGLACGAAGTLLLLMVVENYAPQPLVPLRLFRDRVFVLAGVTGAVLGAALFAAAGCLPLLLRAVPPEGAAGPDPLTLPLAGGVAVGAVLSGCLVGRTGHHKLHPVLGCAAAATGMWLLSRTDAGAPRLEQGAWQAVLGAGVGLALPVLVLAVRDAVPAADAGSATVAHHYVRQLGGCLGATACGALLADRLAHTLPGGAPAGADLPPGALDGPADAARPAHTLPAALRDGYLQAYAGTVPGILLLLAALLVLGLVLALFLRSGPPATLSVPSARTAPGPLFGVPVSGTVRHPDGSPVPLAAVTLIDGHGRQVGRATSGDDGRYALSAPGRGAYVLVAAAGGHRPQAVTVTAGERPAELDVVLGGVGRLAGTVRAADGTPLPDATVTLTDGRGDVVAGARSGRGGGYVITGLVAGAYTLAAGAPGFRPAALPVEVDALRETRQDVELTGGAMLCGAVRAPGGRLVEDARVTLLDALGNVVHTLTTGPEGTFRFADLSAGEYTLIAAGYPPVATVLQVAGGGGTERDLRLGHGY